jgi:chromosome segregation ATPase
MSKGVEKEIQELEAKLQQLKAAQIEELQERLRDARRVVRDLEQEIEKLSGSVSPKRKRISSAEVRDRIYSVMKGAKGGLSQKQISLQSGIGYGTVALFLRRNEKEFKSTGSRKSKRYFWK